MPTDDDDDDDGVTFNINELYLNLGFWLAACAYVLYRFGYIGAIGLVGCSVFVYIVFSASLNHILRSSTYYTYIFIGLHIRAKRHKPFEIRFDLISHLYAKGKPFRLIHSTTWVMRIAHPDTLNSHENRFAHTHTCVRMCCTFVSISPWMASSLLLHNMFVCTNFFLQLIAVKHLRLRI